MTPWEILGVAPDVAVADLRRRYAALIKEFRPETHPQDFARIREAYESVLAIARRREAESVEAAAAAERAVAVEEVAAPADDPPEVVQAITASDAELEVARPDPGAPDLGTRFHRFHELAAAAAGTRDEAFLPELRALLRARASASLDDSQALEFALLRWFIESEQPPLTLLFETGRDFDWHLHPARLSSWLSPWALRQMEARLSLSRDLVHARHFSGNAWLRRMHSPANPATPLASRPATLEALRWAERWQLACADADTPALAAAINPSVLRRLQGRVLLSTDLLFGMVCAGVASNLVEAGIYGSVGATLVFALRQALHRARPALGQTRWFEGIARFAVKRRGLALAGVAGLAVVGFVILAKDDIGGAPVTLAIVLIAPAMLLGVAASWRALAWLETLAAEALAWRGAVDRLELDRALRGKTPADAAAPFGERLAPLPRWKAIPEALRLQRVEVATRARPARPAPLRPIRLRWAKPGKGRMIWIALWVLFAIARGIHAFGQQ